MTQKRICVVKEHSSLKELDKMIKKLETDVRILERLYFIRFQYKGMGVEEASDYVGVTKATGYNWLKLWNKGGYEALIPQFAGGKPSKLSEHELEELKNMLQDEQFTTREVHDLVKEKFGVDYSLSQIRRILKSMGMKYGKPYTKDYRRPENAEKILKKN
jgi:putative transposase